MPSFCVHHRMFYRVTYSKLYFGEHLIMGTVWYLCQFPSKLFSEVSLAVVFDIGLKVKCHSKYNPPTFHVVTRFLNQPFNSSPGNGPLTGRVERSHNHQSSPKSTIRRAQKREPSNLRGSSTPPGILSAVKPALPYQPPQEHLSMHTNPRIQPCRRHGTAATIFRLTKPPRS